MANLYISEDFTEIKKLPDTEDEVDREERWGIGNTGVYETYTDNVSDLYKAMMKEHGRCTGKVYVDSTEGPPKQIGWVFRKLKPYDDDRTKKYLAETWVTVHDAPPTKTVEYHYHPMGGHP